MTIKEIAKKLGVSTSSVSKAIHNASDINELTRARILNYLDEVGYNKQNRLTNKKLCVFFEDIDYSTTTQIGYAVLNGFKKHAYDAEYLVDIKTISKLDMTIDYDREMRTNKYIGGFIIGANLQSYILSSLKNTEYPTILLDNYIENSNDKLSFVGTDNITTITQVVTHLVKLGHKRIAFLGGEKPSVVTRERTSSYIIGLLSNDLPIDEKIIFFGNYQESCCVKFIDSIIYQNITAVVCASDLIAVGLIKQLTLRGINVPKDISVTGFDDIELSSYITPTLSTIKQDFEGVGKSAFIQLRQIIKGAKTNKVMLKGKFIIRESIANCKY